MVNKIAAASAMLFAGNALALDPIVVKVSFHLHAALLSSHSD